MIMLVCTCYSVCTMGDIHNCEALKVLTQVCNLGARAYHKFNAAKVLVV